MSLDLDDRQRAMLQEMGVRVWWPKTAVPVDVPGLIATPVKIQNAPENIAIKQVNTGAIRPFSSETSVAQPVPPEPPVDRGDVALLDWPALQQAVSACKACALCQGRQNTVFGVGQPVIAPNTAPQVDWLVVGEAPGENEDRTGEPFVGQAGQLLDNMLKAMGLSRERNVYIVNVVKCRPPGNRNPELSEIAQCEPFLRRQIELLQPKIILAMGRFAANALLQATVPDVHKQPLGKLRGQVFGYTSVGRVIPVVATYHPAYLLRSLPEKAKAWADVCLAMDVLQRASLPTMPA